MNNSTHVQMQIHRTNSFAKNLQFPMQIWMHLVVSKVRDNDMIEFGVERVRQEGCEGGGSQDRPLVAQPDDRVSR